MTEMFSAKNNVLFTFSVIYDLTTGIQPASRGTALALPMSDKSYDARLLDLPWSWLSLWAVPATHMCEGEPAG